VEGECTKYPSVLGRVDDVSYGRFWKYLLHGLQCIAVGTVPFIQLLLSA